MINETIKSQLQLSLEQLYPDKFLQGNAISIEEVDFFMEQCVVITKPDEVSSQQRVIAIIAAEWAKFSQNYNYKVSAGWFKWHDMMRQARAKLAHLPEQNVEGEARKLVKNELIQRYGKDAFNAVQDGNAFLVERADWNEIDALAKSICDQLQIHPDQLIILMVAGPQNQSPSPQVQGLCRHGHELRFCVVDDLQSTLNTWYFYERDSKESLPCEIPDLNSNSKKPSLRELLQAPKKTIKVTEKASPISLDEMRILEPGKPDSHNKTNLEPKIMTWNIGMSRNAIQGPWTEIKVCETLLGEDADVVFLQEVPHNDGKLIFNSNEWSEVLNKYHMHCPNLYNLTYPCPVTLLKKDRSNDALQLNIIIKKSGYVRAFVISDDIYLYINIHLTAPCQTGEKANYENRLSECEEIGKFIKTMCNRTLVVGGDFNESRANANSLVEEINKSGGVKLQIASNIHNLSKMHWVEGPPDPQEVDFILIQSEGKSSCLFNDPIPEQKSQCGSRFYLNAHFPVVNYNNRIVRIDVVSHQLDSLIPEYLGSSKPIVYSGNNLIFSNQPLAWLCHAKPYYCDTKPPSVFAVGIGLEYNRLWLSYFGEVKDDNASPLEFTWRHEIVNQKMVNQINHIQ